MSSRLRSDRESIHFSGHMVVSVPFLLQKKNLGHYLLEMNLPAPSITAKRCSMLTMTLVFAIVVCLRPLKAAVGCIQGRLSGRRKLSF